MFCVHCPENDMKNEIIKEIIENRKISKSFRSIISEFENKFKKFNPTKNSVAIETYFGEGVGKVTALELLLRDGIVKKDWLKENEKDFKGLYVFSHKKNAFYVGISRGVIKRILQHIKGKSHNTSTLAYKIGILKYNNENNKPYNKTRTELNFENYVEPFKEFLSKQNIAFISIENDEELALFEIFCSMKLKTKFNTFETH